VEAPSREMSPHYNYLNDASNTIQPDAMMAIRLIMYDKCIKCGKDVTKVYWPFSMRLCFVCVNRMTVKRAALEWAYGKDERLLELGFVYLPLLRDLEGGMLHGRGEIHFLIKDVCRMRGDHEVEVGEVFEDFEGEGKNDYMSRKKFLFDSLE
jgi:hypothetical protein